MNIGIYIQMNVVSSLICVLLYRQQKKHKVFDFLGSTAFNSILMTAVLLMSLDIVAWLMLGDVLPHTLNALMLVLSIYYLIQALLPLFFLEYCLNASGRTVSSILRAVMYIPIIFTVVILFLNFSQPLSFYLVGDSIKRTSGFILAILAPMIYILTSLILCSVFYFKAPAENKNVSYHLLICVIFSFAGAALSALISSISPWHIFVFSLVYLYMQVHSAQERKLDVLAYQDSLTGLMNYAAYSHAKWDIDRRIREDECIKFSVAVMDINNLKKTNDAYGHEAGNELILSSSRLISAVFPNCPIYRIGGDEFVVILEGAEYEGRGELLERFNETMKKTTFLAQNKKLPLSIAIGETAYDSKLHRTYADVFHAADEAMYNNKAKSKNSHIVIS